MKPARHTPRPQVLVTDVRYKGETINGKYPLVSVDEDKVTILYNELKLRVPKSRVQLPDASGMVLSYDELLKEIKGRFDVLDRMMSGIISGRIRSLIVSGAPGVGKSFSTEAHLHRAKVDGTIKKYTIVRGTISPISLYMLLWEHRKEGQVVVLDDADSVIFSGDEGPNIIKCVTDSGKKRSVSYYKEVPVLEAQGIPKTFDFEGAFIMATNVNFEREIEAQSKIAVHLSAILNRALYLDLRLFDKQALMARVEDVCRTTPMLHDFGLDGAQVEELIKWLKDNQATVRSMSLRTAGQLAGLILTSPDNWRHDAKVTLLQSQR